MLMRSSDSPFLNIKKTAEVTAILVKSGIAYHEVVRTMGAEMPMIGGRTLEDLLGFRLEERKRHWNGASLFLAGKAGLGAYHALLEANAGDQAVIDALQSSVMESAMDLFGSG